MFESEASYYVAEALYEEVEHYSDIKHRQHPTPIYFWSEDFTLNVHEDLSDPTTVKSEPTEAPSDVPKKSQKKHTWKCTLCSYGSCSKKRLEAHKEQHMNSRVNFPCKDCGSVLFTKGHWKQHTTYCDLTTCRKFKCTLCKFQSLKGGKLQKHMRLRHADSNSSGSESKSS